MSNALKVVYRHMPERSDDCIYCKAKRSVEMYNDYNRPINYSTLLDNNTNMLALKIKYAKCNNCGRQSNIFWDHTQTPIPLYTTSLVDLFMQINFKQL